MSPRSREAVRLPRTWPTARCSACRRCQRSSPCSRSWDRRTATAVWSARAADDADDTDTLLENAQTSSARQEATDDSVASSHFGSGTPHLPDPPDPPYQPDLTHPPYLV